MKPLGQIDAPSAQAFARALSDPAIAEALEQNLIRRRDDLTADLNRVSVTALTDPAARTAGLILKGQLAEVNSWLEAVSRFIETGRLSNGKPQRPTKHA